MASQKKRKQSEVDNDADLNTEIKNILVHHLGLQSSHEFESKLLDISRGMKDHFVNNYVQLLRQHKFGVINARAKSEFLQGEWPAMKLLKDGQNKKSGETAEKASVSKEPVKKGSAKEGLTKTDATKKRGVNNEISAPSKALPKKQTAQRTVQDESSITQARSTPRLKQTARKSAGYFVGSDRTAEEREAVAAKTKAIQSPINAEDDSVVEKVELDRSITGFYPLVCPDVESNWQAYDIHLLLLEDDDNKILWGHFDLTIVTGYLLMDSREFWSKQKRTGHVRFQWRAWESETGKQSSGWGQLNFVRSRLKNVYFDGLCGPKVDFTTERAFGPSVCTTRRGARIWTTTDFEYGWAEYGSHMPSTFYR